MPIPHNWRYEDRRSRLNATALSSIDVFEVSAQCTRGDRSTCLDVRYGHSATVSQPSTHVIQRRSRFRLLLGGLTGTNTCTPSTAISSLAKHRGGLNRQGKLNYDSLHLIPGI